MPPVTTRDGLNIYLRWMIRRDMHDVLDIEQESFEFPWCEDDFIRCLRQRNCIGMVAEHDDRITGYMIYELQPKSLQLLNLAIDQDWRRRGIATAMLDYMKGKLSQSGRTHILEYVAEHNLRAQLFFRSCGFEATGIHHDVWEDDNAYRMVYLHGKESHGCSVYHATHKRP